MYRVLHLPCGDAVTFAVYQCDDGTATRVAVFDDHDDAEAYTVLMNLFRHRDEVLADLAHTHRRIVEALNT
jgi:hypothetical protein